MNVMNSFYRLSIKPVRRARESKQHIVRLVQACLYVARSARGFEPG